MTPETVATIQIIVLFLLPSIALYLRLMPRKSEDFVLVGMWVVIAGVTAFEKWKPSKLGLRLDNINETILPYLIFTLVGIVITVLVAKALDMHPPRSWKLVLPITLLPIPVAFFQEFIFRGFLMPKLFLVFSSPFVVIMVNALIFALAHIFWKKREVILPLTFLAGIGFATMYYFYPNLIVISASHAVLNFIAVLYGFFRWPKKTKFKTA